MSKLWIVHRNPRRLDALARLSGLVAPDLVCGAPADAAFAGASSPAAILIGAEDDFELELEFLHRHRGLLEGSRRHLIAAPEDVFEVKRLFGASSEEIFEAMPSPRELRALVLSAVAHRNAETLAERRDRERISRRFASWFGELAVPGLLRAIDPALATLPLLVRGVPGSGRTLVARYAELFRLRGARGSMLRLHAKEIAGTNDLISRLQDRERAGLPGIRSIWIDEIDLLGISAQHALSEWIRLGAAPTAAVGTPLRWIATAGPAGLTDLLEAELERAFAPLTVEVPALSDHSETLALFAQQVASEWTATVGGVAREISPSAIEALAAYAWSGDRAAVEAVLRSALASTSRNPVEETDLLWSSRADAASGGEASETEPIREAVFADAASAISVAAEEPASESANPPVDEFERAFLEGLPTETPVPLSESQVPQITADRDVSTELSEESFHSANADASTRQPDPATETAANTNWRRLARSLSHEIRNPLVSIRTFAELLPEHFADESFRSRFTDLVGRDVAHIDEVISRLASAAEREKVEASAVDVSAMIESLLDARRDRIAQGRLLVLRELERESPNAWVDSHSIEVALAGLLDRALASLPERGDLFVATRRIERAADGTPRLRVLLRHHNPELGSRDGSGLEELGSAANVLEYVLAETIVGSNGGTLTIDSTDAQETLILVDLKTPD